MTEFLYERNKKRLMFRQGDVMLIKVTGELPKEAKIRNARNYLERVAQDLNGSWIPSLKCTGYCLHVPASEVYIDVCAIDIKDLSWVYFRCRSLAKKAAEILKRDRPDVLETLFSTTKLGWEP